MVGLCDYRVSSLALAKCLTIFRSTNNKFEHLIVTDLGKGPHCLYVHEYDSINDVLICKNSHGPSNNPTPSVKIGDIMNFYRVSATATALTLQQATTAQQLLLAQNLNSSTITPLPQQVTNADIYHLERIIKNCEDLGYNLSLSETMQAARLASSGYIVSLKYLKLEKINLGKG